MITLVLLSVVVVVLTTLTYTHAVPVNILRQQQHHPPVPSQQQLQLRQRQLSSNSIRTQNVSNRFSAHFSIPSSSSSSSSSLSEVTTKNGETWNFLSCLRTADAARATCRHALRPDLGAAFDNAPVPNRLAETGLVEEACEARYNQDQSLCQLQAHDCVFHAETLKWSAADENVMTALMERCADGYTKQLHYRNAADAQVEAQVMAGQRVASPFGNCFRGCDASRFACRSPLKPGDAEFADRTFDTKVQQTNGYWDRNPDTRDGESVCQEAFYHCVDACLLQQEACMRALDAISPNELLARSKHMQSC